MDKTNKLSAGYWHSQVDRTPKYIHEEAEKERWIEKLKNMIKKHPDTKYLTDFLKKFLKDLEKPKNRLEKSVDKSTVEKDLRIELKKVFNEKRNLTGLK